jgi:hypothetical protein
MQERCKKYIDRILVGKLEDKKPVGRHRCKVEIKVNVKLSLCL